MAAGRTQTATDGMTTQQQREVLADMVKGGKGTAMGVIQEEVLDGKRCFTFLRPNAGGSRYEPVKCICDTYEHAQALLNIGQLEI